jgi:hypothetical protein
MLARAYPQGPTILGTGNGTPRYPSYPVPGGIAGPPSLWGLYMERYPFCLCVYVSVKPPYPFLNA